MVLFYRKNSLSYSRKAFVASKKVGKSVTRNRARRLMKESLRHLEASIPNGYDILVIARNTISSKGIKCADVELSIKHLFKKSGLFDK